MMRAQLLMLALASVVGCGEAHSAPPAIPAVPAVDHGPPSPRPLPGADPRPEDEIFEQARLKVADMNFDQVAPSLLRASDSVILGFDPTTARYWPEVAAALQLTDQEKQLFASKGVVASDHGMGPRFSRRGHNGNEPEGYSMAGMYYAIWAHDLPVLVTTDSILHALHRTFSQVLQMLEAESFKGMLTDVLAATHGELRKRLAAAGNSALLRSLRDVDVYLTVARNLLFIQPQHPVRVHSLTGEDATVSAILDRIAAETVTQREALWGGQRPVDWSQFRPRGHYANSPAMQQYFRTMMWLGRADIGWVLSRPDPQSQLAVDVEREQLDAAVLALLIRDSGALDRLESIRRVLGFLVGPSDELTVPAALGLIKMSGSEKLEDLSKAEARKRLDATLVGARAGAQRIASQTLHSRMDKPQPVRLPAQFQMFGQRFTLDSFVLSRVVFDSILYRGEKQERWMPSGLDVMAALGNDEAFALLERDLRAYHYEPNLLAARTVVESYDDARWGESLYSRWLGSLRWLDDTPNEDVHFPRAMRSRAWQHKELQTQLASWAELRHDTILYAKQSYGRIQCSYPAGYVEPYPRFYASIKQLATRVASLLANSSLAEAGTDEQRSRLRFLIRSFSGVFEHLKEASARLETLSQKEIAGEPFTAEEADFLKQLIVVPSLGCGAPLYSGWYPALFFVSDPAAYCPVIADIHTDPQNGKVLEAGVGGASFLVVAIDNDEDRRVYVGPAYSYYEFTVPTSARMTDEEWETLLAKQPPTRPAWTESFQAAAVQRDIQFWWAPPGHKPIPPTRGAPPAQSSSKAPPGGRPPPIRAPGHAP